MKLDSVGLAVAGCLAILGPVLAWGGYLYVKEHYWTEHLEDFMPICMQYHDKNRCRGYWEMGIRTDDIIEVHGRSNR